VVTAVVVDGGLGDGFPLIPGLGLAFLLWQLMKYTPAMTSKNIRKSFDVPMFQSALISDLPEKYSTRIEPIPIHFLNAKLTT
jgi:hypothetical protein